MVRRMGFVIAALLVVCLGAGCAREPERLIEKKLAVILDDDLATVVAELPKESVADTTFYEIRVYKQYKEGKYGRLATVDFYFLKNVKVKMVRKYRYYMPARKWERYFNEYEFIHE